jgi:signal transduction histidine kinase
MQSDGGPRGSRLEDRVRLIIVDSPEVAAPLVSVLDVADVGAWMWVETERALYLSARVLDLLGLPFEPQTDLLSRFIHGVHPDDQETVLTLLRRESPAGAFDLRYRFTPPEGPLRWIEDRGRVERTRSGELVRQGGTIREVTREVGRELERREAHARLEALVNAMPFAVWGRSGPARSVTHQNAESIAAWGDIRGSALSDAPVEVRALWQAQMADVMTGQIVRGRHEYVRQGERRILQEIVAPVVVEDEVTGAVGVAIDITDEERARSRMQETHKLESLGVLAGGIAHDFNNLLTAILGNASLLRLENNPSATASAQLDQIEAAARRAAELCRQMLAYAGRGRFALRPLDLNELIRGIEALMAVTVPKRATIEFSFGAHLPPVLADETQIQQLLMNLVINAAEALRDGPGTISIATSTGHRSARELAATAFSPQLSDGEYVSLTVSDTGEGMNTDTLARIFDPFFSTRFTGRGLGLAAVVGIIRAHKGALRVESHPGSGSTFELLLPVHEERPAVRFQAMASEVGPERPTWRATGTILVVDDEFGVRTLTRSVLERAGLTVLLAEDGGAGVESFRTHANQVRVVMVDLTMPGLDGRETLQQIRRIRPDVPAILMSGYTPADLDDCPAHEFLQKPFTPTTLRAMVRRILGE